MCSGQCTAFRSARRRPDAEFAKVDLILTPTTGTIYRIEEVEADPIGRNSDLGYYTNYMNLLDYSALAVPGGTGRESSVRVTLVGKVFEERRLLEAACRSGRRNRIGSRSAERIGPG